MTRARLPRPFAVLLVPLALVLAVACGGGRASPTETLASLRSALVVQDGRRVYELHDAEARSFYRQRARTFRARLAAGEPPEEVLQGEPAHAAAYTSGTEEDAVAALALHDSVVASLTEWLRSAQVIDEQPLPDDGRGPRALLRLRGADGVVRELRFVKEAQGWSLDQFGMHRAGAATGGRSGR